MEAGDGFVQIVPANPDREGDDGGGGGGGGPLGDTCVILDRTKIESVGIKAIASFLQRIQVYKATVRWLFSALLNAWDCVFRVDFPC